MEKPHKYQRIEEVDRDFEELLVKINSAYGLPPIIPKILGILILEAREVSMEEIAERTGYSLSSVSNSLKNMETMGILVRVHKAGTKKVYVRVHNSWRETLHSMMMRMYELKVQPVVEELPHVIEKYNKVAKSSKGAESEEAKKRVETLQRLKTDMEFLKSIGQYMEKCYKTEKGK